MSAENFDMHKADHGIHNKKWHNCAPIEELLPSPGYVSCDNEKSDFMAIVQVMLRCIDSEYEFDEPVLISGKCDDATKAAIMKFQEINELEKTGHVDCETWKRICSEYSYFAHPRNPNQ
ncbi:MAG: peptidoglycan-binding protein [Clostridia bacterium]|nr:peptidoglycan-binding protein [Clostridia bacterium]